MLVLNRRSSEQIVIGTDIRITVLDIQGKRVRLGITAPDGVSVLREELLVRVSGQPRSPARDAGRRRSRR
jgi:carbon storage regulator